MKRLTFLGSCLTALLAVTVYFSQTPSADALTKDTVAIMTNIQEGDTEISRIGQNEFRPERCIARSRHRICEHCCH